MANRASVVVEGQDLPTPLDPTDFTVIGGYVHAAGAGAYPASTANTPVVATVPLRDPADNGSFEVGGIEFDQAFPSTVGVGKLTWNSTQGTLDLGLQGGNVVVQLGQENVLKVRNEEVTPLVDGEVVYIYGSSGTHNTVKRASALTEGTSANTIGVVTEPIGAHPGEGFITTFGMVTCDTNHLTEGAAVWLSTVSGQTTSTKPTAPNHLVLIGFCVKKAGPADGRIFVSVNNGYELSELHDVYINAIANGDILQWVSANNRWQNVSLASGPFVLKTGDTITVPTGTGLTVNSTDGLGELALKVRTAAATSTSAQAGMDYGFSSGYRITQAVAGSGLAAPFGGSAYIYASGVPLRFITDNIARGIEFWAGSIYAGRVLNGTTQLGTAPSGVSTTNIPLYCGKASTTVQARLGDTSGNCWSFGRDNISTGDLIIEPTIPAGTSPYAGAFKVFWGSGITRCTYGLQVGDLTLGRIPFVSTSGRLSDSASLTWASSTLTAPTIAATTGIVVPKTVGTGIKVDTTTPTFGWRDMLGEIVARGTGASNPTWSAFRGGIYGYQFQSATINEVWTNFHIPHDWIPGTDLYAHVHWSQNVVDTGGPAGVPGAAKWFFELTYADGYGTPGGAGDPFFAPITVSIVQQASTTQYAHMIAEVQCGTAGGAGGTMLDTSTIAVDGIILCRLWRDKTDPADTLDQGPFIHMCDIHYQTNGVMGTKDKNPPFYT